MITVDEIREKALRRYEDYLRSLIEFRSIFPLNIPGDKELERESGIGTIQEQLLKLYKADKSNTGFGYTLTTDYRNTKFGRLPIIKGICFNDETDFLRFIGKESEVQDIKLLLSATLTNFPELKSLLWEKPILVADNLDKWYDLLKVCSYFKQNPRPDVYIRELPVNLHTKFIEANKGVLTSLLSVVVKDAMNTDAENFEAKFHLKSKHNLIRIRFLDKTLSPFSGYSEIGIAETEINTVQISPKRVFIVENDITALTFPPITDSILIFGKGYNLSALKEINWLKETDIFYWSDLDIQGFEMLSQIRSYFPQTRAFLMDEATLRIHHADTITGIKSKRMLPPLLSEEDASVYCYLRDNNLRLEQEKIPQSWVMSAVSRLANSSFVSDGSDRIKIGKGIS